MKYINSYIDIVDVSDEFIITKDKYISLIKVEPINFELKSNLEKQSIIMNFENFINLLNSNIQILIFKQKQDLNSHISNIIKNKNIDDYILNNELYNDYIDLIQSEILKDNVITIEYYIVISDYKTSGIENIKINTNNIIKNLRKCGNKVFNTDKQKKIQLLKNIF